MRKGWIGWLAGLALLGCATARAAVESPAMAAAPAWVQEEPLPAAPGGNAGLRYELVSDQLDLTGPRPRWFRRVSYTVRRDNALADAGQIGLYYQPDYQSLVLNHLEVWRDGRRIVALDIPLLFETRGEGRVDRVLVVSAPASVQRIRVLRRPGMTEERLASIRARQMPDREKRRRADHVVFTGLSRRFAQAAIHRLIRTLLK